MGYRPISCPHCRCNLSSMLDKYRDGENPQRCPQCERLFMVEEEVKVKWIVTKAYDTDPTINEEGSGI